MNAPLKLHPARVLSSAVVFVLIASLLAVTQGVPDPASATPQAAPVRMDPVPVPTSIVLASDRTEFVAGDSAILSATTDVSVSGTSSVISIIDQTTSTTLKSCGGGTTCTVSHSFRTGGPHTYVAQVDSLTSNPVVVSRAPWTLGLTTNKAIFATGDQVTLTATANQNLGYTNDQYYIRIYDQGTGATVKACSNATACTLSTTFLTGPPRSYIADISRNTGGANLSYGNQTDVQATSNPVSVARQTWTVTLAAQRTVFAAGENIGLTATANQDVSNSVSTYYIHIYDTTTGEIVKTCASGPVCFLAAAFYTGGPHTYSADVSSSSTTFGNRLDVQATSNQIAAARKPWTLSLQATSTTFSGQNQYTLTATGNQDMAGTYTRLAYIFRDNTTGQYLYTCYTETFCTHIVYQQIGAAPHSYSAMIINTATGEIETSAGPFLSNSSGGPTLANETTGGLNPAEAPCQCNSGDPVNSATGEFYLPATDISLPGAGPQLAISRTYSALTAGATGSFGFGWATNFDSTLSTTLAGNASDPLPRQVQIVQENGSTALHRERRSQLLCSGSGQGNTVIRPGLTAVDVHTSGTRGVRL